MDIEKERIILQLRAEGKSYATIAKETGVGKQTALDVCKKYRERVATLAALELDELYTQQRITSRDRIEALASLSRRVRNEIERRNLSTIPTEKLIELYLKQEAVLKEEMIEPDFKSSQEQEEGRQSREYLDGIAGALRA